MNSARGFNSFRAYMDERLKQIEIMIRKIREANRRKRKAAFTKAKKERKVIS